MLYDDFKVYFDIFEIYTILVNDTSDILKEKCPKISWLIETVTRLVKAVTYPVLVIFLVLFEILTLWFCFLGCSILFLVVWTGLTVIELPCMLIAWVLTGKTWTAALGDKLFSSWIVERTLDFAQSVSVKFKNNINSLLKRYE